MANKFKVDLANLFTNWNDDVGGWASSTGGAGIVSHPVDGDVATLDASSGNLVVNVDSACTSMEVSVGSTYAGAITGSNKITFSGRINGWPAGSAYAGLFLAAPTGAASSARAFNPAVTIAGASLEVNASTGTNGIRWSSGTLGGTVTLTQGVLTMLADMTCSAFISSNTNTRTFTIGSQIVTLTGTGTVWDVSTPTNLTLSAASSTIVISNSSASAKAFAGGGKVYGVLTIAAGTGSITLTGNNAFSTLTCPAPMVLTGTTTTCTAVVLTGCTAITGGTLSVASGTVTAPAGCTITNNTATGGAYFDARQAIDGGGNSGWTFADEGATAGYRWFQMGRHFSRYWRRIR